MTRDILKTTLNALDSILEEERLALLSGELNRISDLMAEKEALIDTLKQSEIGTTEDLDPVQQKLRRNQELFDHALAGVRSVAERLATLRHLRKALDTYTADGQRSTILEMSDHRLERRA
ncbi:flagellar protein FlgN [Aestuariicoccus sp. MJ-SS9]|uniref:flagellar protein FlgN n=1 Tax=Aestuariicoccus sp. MJ-SS9 TaxID=3079855 RepID=UPI00290990F6|nr:flagellar protein FlgN [Aestuariicoccus sp. MJ-SS9]MDU8910973.1 flagellar protein FlgN [Aestuariicoccus sp. MJ-SS9]